MTLTANDQYILELINRGRLDPMAEAARYGIDLNKDLAQGTITGETKQVVGHNAQLTDAATDHSNWMLAANRFSHTGQNGSSIFDRVTDAGYDFVGPLQTYGENLSWGGSTAGIDLNAQAQVRYDNLFHSAGHRVNTLNGDFREVGISHEEGNFTTGGRTYNASMLTENFATSGTEYFLTGVAYNDRNNNDFYGIGEGRGDVLITVNGQTATTAHSGGYTIGVQPDSAAVTIRTGGTTVATLSVDLNDHNVKLDVINTNGQWDLALSGSADLGSGIGNARLLGLNDLSLSGHNGANSLFGNHADNRVSGEGGNDFIHGRSGHDVLLDGAGVDVLVGGWGRDTFVLAGDGQLDTIRDFHRAEDRLDLRGWNGLSDVSELSITATSTGARITWNNETLNLNSASGQSIAAQTLNNDMFMFGSAPSGPPVGSAPSMKADIRLIDAPTNNVTGIDGTGEGDILTGTKSGDYIFGYKGNDFLDGRGGADQMFGSLGNDIYVVDHVGDQIGWERTIADGGDRADTVRAWIDYILPRNIEILSLRGGADLNGGGNLHRNKLFGNKGDNLLDGGAGNDIVRGGGGNDVIVGGAGVDRLWGGGGADTFLFAAVTDSGLGGARRDKINSFEAGKDQIDLSYLDADTLRGGHQSFDFIETDGFSGNGFSSAGELRYFAANAQDTAIVAIDRDGDGRADMQITVRGTDSLTADDFIL